MLTRAIPSRLAGDVWETIEEDRRKELMAALSIYHPMTFKWDTLFEGHNTPIADNYPNPSKVNYEIYKGLLRAKEKLQSILFYPQTSWKSIGDVGRLTLLRMQDQVVEAVVQPSTEGLELLYSRTGYTIRGPTEMRTSFGLNDLRPRTYYARGPDVFYPSRYIQAIFNVLVDMIPVTERYQRYLVTQLMMQDHETLLIYDYSSFTSSLHEIKNFTEALARYFSGTDITVVDSYEGVKTVDLGELLMDFNETCNNFPSFTIRPYNGPHQYSDNVDYHNCGMLGVPGNISSCTLLHGIHLAILLCSVLCRAVGDDAIGVTRTDEVDTLICDYLTNIGKVSIPKTTRWDLVDEEGWEGRGEDTMWHYTKRPIGRYQSRVMQGWQAIFPPATYFTQEYDPLRSARAPYSAMEYFLKANRYSKTFVASLSHHQLTEFGQSVGDRFCHYMRVCAYRECDHLQVSSPRFRRPHFVTVMPNRCGVEGLEDIEWEWKQRKGGYVPKEAIPYSDTEYYVVNREYSGRKLPVLSYMVKMGWGSMEEEPWVYVHGGDDFFKHRRASQERNFQSSYSWQIYDSAPQWVVDLITLTLSRNTLVSLDEGSDYNVMRDPD
jgi:hypothetical protein